MVGYIKKIFKIIFNCKQFGQCSFKKYVPSFLRIILVFESSSDSTLVTTYSIILYQDHFKKERNIFKRSSTFLKKYAIEINKIILI